MITDIIGVKIDALTYEQTLKSVNNFLNEQKFHYIITANPELLLKCWSDEKLLKIVNQADLVTIDGVGLLWAAGFLKTPSKYFIISLVQAYFTAIMIIFKRNDYFLRKVTGVDLMEKICNQAAKNNKKIYLLGGQEGIAHLAAKILKDKYINLNIAGQDYGTDNIDQATEKEKQLIIDKINSSQAEILFVAFGQPKQEFWIDENKNKLTTVKLAMGVGGAFDFISGRAKRAPEIYQEIGLEWLWRLFNEPRRALRIFNATFKFIYRITILKQHFKTN
jgi:N-acetylglucosaminyldiphosphoundecaprenol N-acetyl-beta-D-mannosaminyltransferase